MKDIARRHSAAGRVDPDDESRNLLVSAGLLQGLPELIDHGDLLAKPQLAPLFLGDDSRDVHEQDFPVAFAIDHPFLKGTGLWQECKVDVGTAAIQQGHRRKEDKQAQSLHREHLPFLISSFRGAEASAFPFFSVPAAGARCLSGVS